jgi:GNAT superfamily N-acetyltransferase
MGITVREADLERELPLLASTVNAAFGSSVSEERFRWLYLDNPDGRAVAWFAVNDETGEIAGCTAVSPRRVLVRDREVLAWNCGDFSIAKRYRTLGTAVKLRRAARERIDAGKCAFLYAHPNDRMLQIHLRVGHQPLAKMHRYAKPLQFAPAGTLLNRWATAGLRLLGSEALVRVTGDVQIVTSETLPADIDDVYQEVQQRLGTAVVRDRRYLNWRFHTTPQRETETLILRANGRPTAYVVFSLKNGAMTIKDWLAIEAGPRDQAFVACLREARRRGAASATVSALETHPDISALRRLGFARRPESTTVVTYATEGTSVREAVTDATTWYMTLGDRDV